MIIFRLFYEIFRENFLLKNVTVRQLQLTQEEKLNMEFFYLKLSLFTVLYSSVVLLIEKDVR